MKARVRIAVVAVAGALLLSVAALVVFLHQSLAGTLLLNGAGKFLGDDVTARDVRISLHHLAIGGLRIRTLRGEPVLDAESLDVEYNLRDLLPGGKHRYGVSAIDLERPHLTVIHRQDGTFNIVPPGGSQQGSQQAAPLDVRVAVRNGSGTFVDQRRRTRAGAFAIDEFAADVALHSIAPSRYLVRLVVDEKGTRYPVRGDGLLNDARGWEMQRWTARAIGIAPLADFALDPTAMTVVSGELRNVDIRYAGIPDASGQIARYLDADAYLAGTAFYLAGLTRPVRGARGALHGFNDGVVARRLDASLAGVPLRVAGGMVDFGRPAFDLGIVGRGALQSLVTVSPAAARFPVRGDLAFSLLVEGDASRPLVFARFRSPRVTYQGMPFDAPRGSVALFGNELDVVGLQTSYAGMRLGARGRVILTRDPQVELAARAQTPAGALPFTDRVIPGVPLEGDVVAQGTGGRLGATGLLEGSSARQQVAGIFNVAADGSGVAGPLSIDGPGRSSLYARVALDRPHGRFAGFAALHDFSLRVAPDRQLPGLRLPALPEISAVLDGRAVGMVESHGIAVWGDARARNAVVNGIAIDEAHVNVASGTRDLRIGSLEVRAPWGELSGQGDVANGRAALDGRFRGSLAALGRLAGAPSLTGDADVPLRVLWDGTRTIAQISGARLRGAQVAGVAVSTLDGTVALRSNAFDVYAADAGIGGAHVVAAGSFGNGGTVGVSTRNLPLAAFGRSEAGLEGGRLTAVARFSGSIEAPQGGADVAVSSLRLRGQPVDATTALAFENRRLDVVGGDVLVGTTSVGVSGHVDGLALGAAIAPRYALDARVSAADIGAAAAAAHLDFPLTGSLDADIHVGGAGTTPRITGRIDVPEGSVNGQFYRDARAQIDASASGIVANDGSVTVGSSTLAFDGGIDAAARSLHLRSGRLDLADFNDLFDPGDTLAGVGWIDAHAALSPAALRTHGVVSIAGARYRRFSFGSVSARWATTGRTVAGHASVAGSGGSVDARISALLPSARPLDDIAHRSTVDVQAGARGVDLATWLPAAGYYQPIAGHVDADVSAHGIPARATAGVNASMSDGIVGRLALNRFTVAAQARSGRATISSLELDAPSLTVTANGSFGLRPGDAIDAHAHVVSSNVAALAAGLGQKLPDVTGSADASISASGTLRQPSVAGAIDVAQFAYRGVKTPRVHADLTVDSHWAQLQNAEIDFEHGQIRANARTPFDLLHPNVHPNEPVSGMLALTDIDASNFAPLVPKGSTVQGSLDGTVTVAGFASAPAFAGTLTFAKGYYSSAALRSPLRNVTAQMSFANENVTLTQAHADVGTGGVDAEGTASTTLHDPAGALSFLAHARAQNVNLDLPAYFRGVIDGDVNLSRTPHGPIAVAGTVAIPSARIPLTALFQSHGAQATTPPSFPVAFDLAVAAGRDVRVQSGPVDIGATGKVHVGGTLAAPALDGRIVSTGGSVSFYRTFQVQRGVATFSPADGVIPTIDALATTTVPQPSTDVTLNITGLATQLDVQLASNPPYNRSQILGLLLGAQQLGAVSGVAQSSSSGGPGLVQSVAVGTVSQQFTRQVLEPLSVGVGQALGLNNFSLNYDPYGGVSARAVKRLGRHLEGVYAESFNYPRSQSIGLILHPTVTTSFQFTLFQTEGNGVFNPLTIATSTNPALTAITPPSGTNGYSFTFQRHF